MLNEVQKERIINHIYGLVKESIMENGYFENIFPEKEENHSDSNNKEEQHHSEDSKGLENRREAVLRWLDSAQELHSVLARDLWPEKDDDTVRSEFSKKYRGHDADGKEYHFDDSEINTLYNMRGDFIERLEGHRKSN